MLLPKLLAQHLRVLALVAVAYQHRLRACMEAFKAQTIALTFSEHFLNPNLRLGQGNSAVCMIYHLDSGEEQGISSPQQNPRAPFNTIEELPKC